MAIAPPQKRDCNESKKVRFRSPRQITILFFGCVLIIGGIIWMYISEFDFDEVKLESKLKGNGDKHQNILQNRIVKQENESEIDINHKKKQKNILGQTPTGLEYIQHKAQTNNDGVVVSQYQLLDESWIQMINLQSKDSLIFDTALDNELALIARTSISQPLPPSTPIKDCEKAFKEAIKHPIVISEKDSVTVRELKQAVKDIRLQISDLIQEGYTVSQILGEERSLRIKNIIFRREFQKELNEIYRTKGENAALIYMNDANNKLEERGIIPLSLPRK